jgi:hypothetical protein
LLLQLLLLRTHQHFKQDPSRSVLAYRAKIT